MISAVSYSQKVHINQSVYSPSFASAPVSAFKYPDLKQYAIPAVGEYYCAPVSAANAVLALVHSRYSCLGAFSDTDKLISALAKLFKTDSDGTTTINLIKGLEKFFADCGYSSQIKYQGFREIPAEYKVAQIPQLDWVKQEINGGKAVLLNIGVYKKQVEDGKVIYKRQYGHFVNATAQGTDGLSPAADFLTIHDPYNRVAGDHYIKLAKIKAGKLIHNKGDNEVALIDNAAGFYEISPRFNYFASDEVGVLNGAISVKLSQKL